MGKTITFTRKRFLPFLLAVAMVLSTAVIAPPAAEVLAAEDDGYKILGAASGNPVKGTDGGVPAYTFDLVTGEKVRISFLNDEIVRINMEPDGNFLDNPVPNDPGHTATILEKPVKDYTGVTPTDNSDGTAFVYETASMRLTIQKADFSMKMERADNEGGWKTLWEESRPLRYNELETIQTLKTDEDEFFYGGGSQNGYFSHKGKRIKIVNENKWENGNVSSPSPFYLSSLGYGVLRHTWKPGYYDFGRAASDQVLAQHQERRFDAFYFAGESMPSALDLYTDITGKPLLMPEWGFYLGHLNAYNRDWVDDNGEQLKPGTPGGHRETLAKEGQDVLDKYIANDMPPWLVSAKRWLRSRLWARGYIGWKY